MGTTEGARTRYRGGREWPKTCGEGRLNHVKRCHPKRPKCKWRQRQLAKFEVCRCGLPHYPHRIRTVDWKNGGACQHHPESDRINFEMVYLRDFDTGEEIDPEDVCADRYR